MMCGGCCHVQMLCEVGYVSCLHVFCCRKLAEVLSLSNCSQSLKEAAQLDYFVAGY